MTCVWGVVNVGLYDVELCGVDAVEGVMAIPRVLERLLGCGFGD